MTRRKLPPSVETAPGDDQGDSWDPGVRNMAWTMYLNHKKGDGLWGLMAKACARSIKSCKAEMWKIYRTGPSGERYWERMGRDRVCPTENRAARHWTEHENEILRTAHKSKIMLPRIAELLGRTVKGTEEQFQRLVKTNRPKLFDLLKEETPDSRASEVKDAIDPKRSPIWPHFQEWCLKNHVSMDHEEDWKDWWSCFVAGATIGALIASKATVAHIEKALFKPFKKSGEDTQGL